MGRVSFPPLKSFIFSGFVFKRKKPLPEPFPYVSVLSRSGWLIPLSSEHANIRSPEYPQQPPVIDAE